MALTDFCFGRLVESTHGNPPLLTASDPTNESGSSEPPWADHQVFPFYNIRSRFPSTLTWPLLFDHVDV